MHRPPATMHGRNAPTRRSVVYAVVLTVLLCAVVIRPACAAMSKAEQRTLFYQASSAYRAGRYDEAVEKYEQLLAEGVHDPVLYYDLGNAYYQLGRRGEAVLMFKRALRLRPRWPEARRNLAIAHPSAPAPPSLLAAVRRWLLANIAPHEAARLASAGWTVALLAMAAGLIINAPWPRRVLRWLTAAGFAIMIFGLIVAVGWWREIRVQPASVIVDEKAIVRSGPGDDYGGLLGRLPPGTVVWQVQPPDSKGWVKIRTETGQMGYVKAKTIKNI